MNKELFAQRVYQLAEPEVKTFDPLTLLAIIQAVVAIINLLKSCGYITTPDVMEVISKPSWLMRFRLRREVSKHVKGELARKVADALPVAASELTNPQVSAIYQEA